MALTKNSICDFGWKARDFALKGVDGKTYTLADVRGPKGTLVVFICNHCPYVKASICALKRRCTTGVQRRVARWEHEHVLEAVQKRLDKNPQAMRQRRETAEHPFGTLKMRMGATHFLMKRLPKVATEMALHVLAYNLTRVMNIMGIQPLMAAIRA